MLDSNLSESVFINVNFAFKKDQMGRASLSSREGRGFEFERVRTKVDKLEREFSRICIKRFFYEWQLENWSQEVGLKGLGFEL